MPLTMMDGNIPRWDDLYIYIDVSSGSPLRLKDAGLLLEWIQTRWNYVLLGTIYLIPLLPSYTYDFEVNQFIKRQLETFQTELADEIPQGIITNILGTGAPGQPEYDQGPPIKIVYPLRTINWISNWDSSTYYRNFPALIQPDIIISYNTKKLFRQNHNFPLQQLEDWDNKPVLYMRQGTFSGLSGMYDTESFLTDDEKLQLLFG